MYRCRTLCNPIIVYLCDMECLCNKYGIDLILMKWESYLAYKLVASNSNALKQTLHVEADLM